MKKSVIISAIVAVIVLSGCAGGAPKPASPVVLPPPPPGTERLTLQNGGLAVFKFELPAGQTWGNYNKMTAEFLVDSDNITRSLRSGAVRLLGYYTEDLFDEGEFACTISLSDDEMFAQKIIDNNVTNWEAMGAVADEWFTYEYNITGSRAHSQFNRANIPAAGARGPFFFGLGLSSQDPGKRSSITQLIRNVTLHHARNRALNVVSTGSGFDLPASVAYYAEDVVRESGGPAN